MSPVFLLNRARASKSGKPRLIYGEIFTGIHTSQGWRTGLLPPTHPASRGAWPVADLEARSRTSPGVEQQLLRLLPGRLRPREFSAAQAGECGSGLPARLPGCGGSREGEVAPRLCTQKAAADQEGCRPRCPGGVQAPLREGGQDEIPVAGAVPPPHPSRCPPW